MLRDCFSTMVSRTITIAAGIGVVALLPVLPPLQLVVLALLLSVLSVFHRLPFSLTALCFCTGLVYGSVFGHLLAHKILPESLEGKTLTLHGQIDGLPEFSAHRGGTWRFNFRVDRCLAESCGIERVRLSYRSDKRLEAGQHWQLKVRLKRPRSYANPGGFDYGRWLVVSGLHASGYVRGGELLEGGARGRARIVQYLRIQLEGLSRHPMLLALAVGDRGRLSDADWEVLRQSGLSHLVAISGLHIGIAAGLGLLCGRLLLPLTRLGPLICALLASGGYAWLAGFSLPTQRALIMVVLGLLALQLGRGLNRWQLWSLALLVVLLLQPLAALSPGFWLSFTAVAVLLAIFDRRRTWHSLFRAQWALLLGLAPLTLAFFDMLSPLSLPVNLVAVPVFSLLLIPLTLLALCLELISTAAACYVWRLANAGVEAVMSVVEWLIPVVPAWHYVPQVLTWLCLCAAAILLLTPRAVPARYLALFLFLPLVGALSLREENPDIAPGHVRVSVLDVGQGLATVIATRNRVLVYDVGPRYSESFDLADAAVLPYLRYRRVNRVDTLVISHNDNDHAGAYQRVQKAYPQLHLLSGERLAGSSACRQGMQWRWDGVLFSLLHPDPNLVEASSNNRSCVLLVQTGRSKVLLPGDIDSAVEQRLLAGHFEAFAELSVLVAPHHGSKTSSSEAFVRQLRPEWVVFSAGYKHHFGHPAEEVVERYRQAGSRIRATADSGAIRFEVSPRGVEKVTEHRSQRRFYWQ